MRREMQPVPAVPRSFSSTFALSAVAATLFFTIMAGALVIRAQRNSALAVDAACDHFDELAQASDKKWATASADVDYSDHRLRLQVAGFITPRYEGW